MKTQIERKNVSLKGALNTKEATIKLGAHILNILAGLYANPADAMVREYLTNCNDGMVALRRSDPNAILLPVIIEVPSRLSPQLVIRDFGIGMDFETAWNTFTSFGESTKSDSNDEVGAMGLGCKSAFAYNSGTPWMIETTKDGVTHIIMAYISETQMPSYAHVSSTKTNEHSGVTIKIPILANDFEDVIKAVKNYARYFPLPLEVKGTTVTPIEYILQATDKSWGITKEDNRGLTVAMGNVPYTYEYVYDLPHNTLLNNNHVIINVPIGSVDIVPSRDDLKYTDRTKITINAAVKKMCDEIKVDVNARIGACESEWDALTTFQAMNHINNLDALMMRDLKWNGKELNLVRGIARTPSAFRTLDASAKYDIWGTEGSYSNTVVRADFDDGSDHDFRVKPNERTWIVLDDMNENKGLRYLKRFLKDKLIAMDSHGKSRRYGHNIGHAVYLRTTLTTQELSDFFGGYPVDQILFVSALAKEYANSTTVSSPKKYKGTIYEWMKLNYKKKWMAGRAVPSTVSYYLPLEKDHNSRYGYDCAIDELSDLAKEIGMTVPTLYGIKNTEVATFVSKGWINFHDALNAKVMDIVNTRTTEMSDRLRQDNQADANLVESLEAIGLKTPIVEEYLKLANVKNRVADDIEAVYHYVYNCVQHSIAIRGEATAIVGRICPMDFKALEEQIYTTYPILRFLVDACHEYASSAIENHAALLLDICHITA